MYFENAEWEDGFLFFVKDNGSEGGSREGTLVRSHEKEHKLSRKAGKVFEKCFSQLC